MYGTKEIKLIPSFDEAPPRDWFSDLEVGSYSSHGALLNRPFSSLDFEKNVLWDVYYIKEAYEIWIGRVSLSNIDWVNRSAEYTCVFGRKYFWGRGFGYESARFVFLHGFEKLNLNKIWLGTCSENIGMVRIAEKLGMFREGVLRRELFAKGKYLDIFRFGTFSCEFSNFSQNPTSTESEVIGEGAFISKVPSPWGETTPMPPVRPPKKPEGGL